MESNAQPPAMEANAPPPDFNRERHILFLEMMLDRLPTDYQVEEVNRLTLAYFVISGLSILGALDQVDKDETASWVLSFQAHPRKKVDLENGQFYGFRGSKTSQFPIDDTEVPTLNCSHLASTYCALSILKILGHSLSSIDSESIVISMRNLQQPNGSFTPTHLRAEADLRFVYCAAAICFILNSWTGIDKEKAKEYIVKCQSYDGGFGLVPGSESHGGATFCAVAALQLMGFIEADIILKPTQSAVINVQSLLEWTLQRQAADGGFQGRANKPSDTCYAFWIGGVLKILGASAFLDKGALRRFLLSCQSKVRKKCFLRNLIELLCFSSLPMVLSLLLLHQYGGFTKFPETKLPDLYHSYYGVSALSLMEEPGLAPLCVELGLICSDNAGI